MFPFGELGWHQGIPKKGIKAKKKKAKTNRKASDQVSPANAFTVDQLLHSEEAGKCNEK